MITTPRLLRGLTPKELSEVTGGLLSTFTIRRYCRLGKMPLARPGRPYLISPSVVEKFVSDVAGAVAKLIR